MQYKYIRLIIFSLLISAVKLTFAQTITVGSVSASVCQGGVLNVPFTASGSFNSGNTFTAQISNSAGSFAAPLEIGTLTGTTGGIINARIAADQPAGNGYRIRIVSSGPSVVSADNGSNITINPLPSVSISGSPATVICPATKVTFTATPINGGSNPMYQWLKNGVAINGASANTYADSTLNDNDTIVCVLTSNATTCGTPNKVTSNQIIMIVSVLTSTLLTTATPDSICAGGSSQLFSGINTLNFSVSSVPYNKIPVPANALIGPVGDDVVGDPVALPFSFNFFGNTYNSFRISTNGNIQFGPTYSTSYTPGPLPNTTIKNFVALCWSDVWVTSNGNNTIGKIRYFVDGVAPRRRMVIDYTDCSFYAETSTSRVSGQILLYETFGIVETHLTEAAGSNKIKTTGVNNFNGSVGAAAPGRNGTSWSTTTPEAWRFTPGQNYTFMWSPRGSLNDSTLERPTATPNTTTEYKVHVTNLNSGCEGNGRVTVTVVPPSAPGITIAVTNGSNPTCRDRDVKFTATAVNQGSNPLYQWIKNGVNISGATSSTYTTTTLNNNDTIRCRLTSNKLCVTTTTAISNNILMSVIGNRANGDTIRLAGCNSVTYNGSIYTLSTTRRDTLRAANGCDSFYHVAFITVTRITPATRDTSMIACNSSITYKGITYNASTVVRDTIRSVQGCDSIYNIANITITNITPLSSPSNLIPVNNRTGLNIPITFSWGVVQNALLYDFYLWKAADPVPTNPVVANLSQINFTYNGTLLYGTQYKWKVVAKHDACSSVSAIQSFTTRFLPDLIVQNIQPASAGFSGQSFTVSWQVKNIGTGATPNEQWLDRVYLSKDAILDISTDTYLGVVSNPSELPSNQSYSQTATFTLPNGISDNYYVFVVTNAYSQLQEVTFNNNSANSSNTSAIQLTPPPDLKVTSIVAPNFAFSGQTINYSWTITNNGSGQTVSTTWADAVYLSSRSDTNLTGATFIGTFNHSGALNASANYITSKSFTLPQGISGKYYLYVLTDIYNQVYEHALEGNNTSRSDSMKVTLTPPVDLVVTQITLPAADASNQENVNIKWRVENQGGSATGNSSWRDDIYMSRTSVYNQDSVILLGSLFRSSTLDIGQGYDAEKTVTVPSSISGLYYIYIKTDASNSIYENIYENNNITRSNLRLNIISPDLLVSKIVVPVTDSSGKVINIDWAVKNNGPGILFNTSITDRIFMSLSSTYSSTNNNIELGQLKYNSGTLVSGDSTLKHTTVKLPEGISGNYYLYIHTDYSNDVYEGARDNNNISRSILPVNIKLSPWPDLQVLNVTIVPDSATAGDVVPLSYRIINKGSRATRDSVWTDNVYISQYPQFDSTNATFIRGFNHSGYLEKNSSYLVSSAIKIPGNIGGAIYYVYVFTDALRNVYEQTDELNNIKKGDSIYVKRYPPVDLAITDIIAPDSASSGNPVIITWSVQNKGMAVTQQSQWKDALYLSTDTVLNSSDVLVKEVTHNGDLAPGMSYTIQNSFVLPNGIAGRYYLLLVADNTDVNNDVNRRNNYRIVGSNGDSAVITIRLTPPPDLIVSSFTIPDRGPAGQPVTATFKIKNAGPGDIKAGTTWTEKIYLSTDLVLDGNDQVIGSYVKSGPLNAGEEYTQTIQVFLPINASGNYVLFIKTDANDNVYEHTAEQNNTRYEPITVEMQLLSDLIVSGFEVPAEAVAGDSVIIKWKIKNIGQNPARGYMNDAVYLSADTAKSVNDALLFSSPVTVNIAPQAEITRTFTGELAGVALNDYYVLTHTDVLNNIYESSDSNNISASPEKMKVTIRQLTVNVVTARSMKNNKEVYYRIEVPDSLVGESLLVTLKADSLKGNNEMYLRFGEAPTRAVYDFSHSLPYQGNQEILVPELKKGTYYLMVFGNTTSGTTQAISLLAKILKFEVRSADAQTGGNTGPVTLQVKGSKFGNVTSLRLRSANNIYSASISIKDPTTLFATFNLAGANLGVYDVIAENAAGDTAGLKNGFTVVAGNAGGLETNVVTPPSTRPSNLISMTIEFTNTGNTDLINPVLKMTSLAGAPIAFSVTDLERDIKELTLVLQELNGPVGRLRPGARGSVIVYAKALTALSFMLLKEE